MSFHSAAEPSCNDGSEAGAIALTIEPRAKDLGEFSVRRVLPAGARRAVGPYVFFDHMGPAEFPPGKGIQVRPHPHIGLATVTYLFEGQIVHRDSLGCVQTIRPGAVNLMTAGRGIVHSERAGDDLDTTARLHGIQTWIALPEAQQECDPAFLHYPADAIPAADVDGVGVRVVIGEAYGRRSPVTTYSPTLYLDCALPAGGALALPAACAELAFYVVDGTVSCSGTDGRDRRDYPVGVMAVAGSGRAPRLQARDDSRVIVIGGEPLGRRHVWWNLVSTSRERIERAKDDWRQGRFAAIPGDDDEFIPLPD